jgi:ribonuclease BN (tRNA processing enzyme)
MRYAARLVPATALLWWIGLAAFPPPVPGQTDGETQAPRAARASQIVFLGTGTPNAEPERSGPCVAVVVGDASYLVDFGPGVVRRAVAAYQMGIDALRPGRLTRAFCTHLHSDHTAGYPDLILTPWVLERNEPLRVYGPQGIREMTEHILAAYDQDIRIRLFGMENADPNGWQVVAQEIRPGVVYQDENVTVEAFPVEHGSWPEAYGFKFRCPDRTIVISGDTRPSRSLVEAAAGCDVLVHEVYSVEGFRKRPPGWQAYHASFHTSSHELAEIATAVRPGLLILYHQLLWGTSEEDLVAEVRENYDGEVVSAHDLDVF